MNIHEIIEQLTDILSDGTDKVQDLYEFAIGRGKAKQKVEDWAFVIMDHLCKILYLHEQMPTTVHHWCAEIRAKVKDVADITIKGGKLDKTTLMKWLRNGLYSQDEMDGRRTIVARQEDHDADYAKPVEPDDYNKIMQALETLVDLILIANKTKKNISVNQIEQIAEVLCK